MSEFVYQNTWNTGEIIQDNWDSGESIQDSFDLPGNVEVITPYYLPQAQLTDPIGRGTVATQIVGGSKPTNYWIRLNNANVNLDVDVEGNLWSYEVPLWFGHNPLWFTFYPMDGYGDTFTLVEDIFLERVYVPEQDGVTTLDGYSFAEGTYYEDEGYGVLPDAYGSTKVLFSCGQSQFPPRLRVKYLTSRRLSSGVIVNGVERDGYLGYKKYFGEGPLFDDHQDSKVEFNDGYDHYYTIRTDGYGEGYGAFRDPLRRYGPADGYSSVNVYDEAENQVFVIMQSKNERFYIREGETLIQLQDKPDSVNEIQIYREYDFADRTPAAFPVSFDSVRKVLEITPFDSDGYGAVYTRIAYTVAGAETLIDGYNDDLVTRNSLEFNFETSLKRKVIGTERNYQTELLDDVTDQKMYLYFFKNNEFNVEMQLNPGFDILHDERFARVGNELNPYYYDNGKREIVVHVDYRGLELDLQDGDGYGPII